MPTHSCVLMQLPESLSWLPCFPRQQQPRHSARGPADCLLRPYTARPRSQAQVPPPFPPSMSLPSVCPPPSPSLCSALPLCPFLPLWVSLSLSFAFLPAAPQPLSFPLSLTLMGPPFALWVCSQAPRELSRPLVGAEDPQGHRPAGQQVSKHSPESGTEHIWTPKAVTAYLPQMLARGMSEGTAGRPLALPCQTQTLSEALEAKGLASIEHL